jgi:hypothetical protein
MMHGFLATGRFLMAAKMDRQKLPAAASLAEWNLPWRDFSERSSTQSERIRQRSERNFRQF